MPFYNSNEVHNKSHSVRGYSTEVSPRELGNLAAAACNTGCALQIGRALTLTGRQTTRRLHRSLRPHTCTVSGYASTRAELQRVLQSSPHDWHHSAYVPNYTLQQPAPAAAYTNPAAQLKMNTNLSLRPRPVSMTHANHWRRSSCSTNSIDLELHATPWSLGTSSADVHLSSCSDSAPPTGWTSEQDTYYFLSYVQPFCTRRTTACHSNPLAAHSFQQQPLPSQLNTATPPWSSTQNTVISTPVRLLSPPLQIPSPGLHQALSRGGRYLASSCYLSYDQTAELNSCLFSGHLVPQGNSRTLPIQPAFSL